MENKNAEALLVKKYVHDESFRAAIEKVRQTFDIPLEGFQSKAGYQNWLKKLGGTQVNWTLDIQVEDRSSRYQKYREALHSIAVRNIPRELFNAFERFAAYPTMPILPWDSVTFDDSYGGLQDMSVHIRIRPYATRSEIIRFVLKNYSSIKSQLDDIKNTKPQRAPKYTDLKLLLIVDKLRRQGLTWDEVARSLRDNHGYPNMWADTIKSFWKRSSNSVRIKSS